MSALYPFPCTADDQEPVLVLYRFFTFFDLPACHRQLSWQTGSMHVSRSATAYDASQRLLFYQQLPGLLQALHQWHLQPTAMPISCPSNKPLNNRLSEAIEPLPWQHLPRHLVRAEYDQPGMVVHAFFHYKCLEGWLKLLYHWQMTMKDDKDVVLPVTSEVRMHLHKVIEAGWLLNNMRFI